MSNWKRLGRDCPICNGQRKHKDCRQSISTGLIFCHDDTANPTGWIFRKHDSNGFGIWQAEADATAYAEQPQLERDREREARQRQKQQRQAAELAAQMPAVERDRWNRKLLKSLSLSEADRAHLLDRGFKPEWIEADGYCSIAQWQALPAGFPLNFPGRTKRGGFVAKSSGIVCPTPDVEKQIVGLQNRQHDGSQGRYCWGSCENAPVHLNGEMPIGVYVPIADVQGDAVWLVDSPVLKGSLARYLFNVFVIGATNGSFASSFKTTRHTLTTLFDRYPMLKRVRLTPDAGDVRNKSVMKRWLVQHDFLIKLGYEVDVAWWEQITKEECDIDELPPTQFDQIRYLSFAQFEAIAREQGGLAALNRKATISNRAAADRYIRQEQEQERIAEAQAWEDFAQQLKRLHTRARPKNGFGTSAQPNTSKFRKQPIADLAPPTTSAIVLYNPAFALRRWVQWVTPTTVPTVAEWEQMGRPVLIYAPADRLTIITSLVEHGYSTVLIADVTGSGKSHFAGEFLQQHQARERDRQQAAIEANDGVLPKDYCLQQAVYTAHDYRNPSTESLEAISEAVSGGALVYDHSKHTPSGNPYRKRALKGQTLDIPALCQEDDNIQTLRAKGIDVPRGKNSVFCQNCTQFEACPYLAEQAAQKKHTTLRTHLNKFSPTPGAIVLVDEAGRAVQGTRQTTATWAQVETEIARIARFDPQLYQSLSSLLDRLSQSLRRAIEEKGYHGLVHADLVKFLPTAEEVAPQLWAAVADAWLATDDPWDFEDAIERLRLTIQPFLKKAFTGVTTPEAKSQVIDELFTVGLIPKLLKAILGVDRTTLTITGDSQIIITQRSYHHASTIRSCATALLMDGTPDPRDLARKLGIKPTAICTVKAVSLPFAALTIKRIRGVGRVGQQRKADSPQCLMPRLLKTIEAIIQAAPDRDRVGLLDLKRFTECYAQLGHDLCIGHHFADNRNSNRFRECTTMISVPLATQHLGLLLAEWRTLTGQTISLAQAPPAFWAWTTRKTTQELLQDIGRTRAQHRPTEAITHWIVSEISDDQWQQIQAYFQSAKWRKLIFTTCAPMPLRALSKKPLIELWRPCGRLFNKAHPSPLTLLPLSLDFTKVASAKLPNRSRADLLPCEKV
ncbi:MAG: hypothetical protein HC895_03670 [Leptolyngbyaceae cyanobacterium SM1_3_5]|nr:hypothetical protein [Leptolyngbyaceae cyanobacterium SM1_3_5]